MNRTTRSTRRAAWAADERDARGAAVLARVAAYRAGLAAQRSRLAGLIGGLIPAQRHVREGRP